MASPACRDTAIETAASSAFQLKIDFIGDLAACAGSHGAQLLLRRDNTTKASPRKWRQRKVRFLARDHAGIRRNGHKCPTNSHIPRQSVVRMLLDAARERCPGTVLNERI
ncbi:hypothetical protein CBOM_08144 [Ceraceosorus bombacis]|uniref:Uncharacterized protein n=1 Tax=Ceraceosorus bombacis TaxID=401625 RepID=A0A0N7L8U6_9BASI|nr:hypothetical protein CBOM_08144 [Ceraceosorus bombacis]